MKNLFRASKERPFHLSVGAVVMDEAGLILCHYFDELPEFGARDFVILMRETMEMGESVEETLARGLMEEFGATARVEAFLGSLTCDRLHGGFEWQKTTLYFLCRLESIDETRRAAEDEERGSVIRRYEAAELVELMRAQGRRIGRGDLDEHEVVQRAMMTGGVGVA